MAVLLCGLLFLVTNSFANTADSYVEHSGYTQNLNSSESPATSPSIYSASTFEHNRQAAQWFMAELVDSLQPLPAADKYLLAKTIPPEWFLAPVTTKHRLAGWKDANLIYKIKNALI